MIATIRPYGAISETLVINKYQDKDKFYAIDDLFNRLEISKEDYERLKCPVRKPKEARRF